MTPKSVAKKLVGTTAGAVGVAAAVVGHVAWYVRYQAEGTVRDDSSDER